MPIKTIPLSRLETELKETLSECADSGETVVIELPDQRLLTIQPLDPQEDDSLIDELLENNTKFQALVAKSKAGPRKPFAYRRFAAFRPLAHLQSANYLKGASTSRSRFPSLPAFNPPRSPAIPRNVTRRRFVQTTAALGIGYQL